MNSPQKDSNRIHELDALRGLSALSVLCFHYTTYYSVLFSPQQPMLFYFPWLSYRVQLFCMISGFVVLMVLEKTKRPLDFVVARFSRLYPCYFAAVLLTACLLKMFPLPQRGVDLPQVLVNLTMLQRWLGVRNVDGVYWYLAPELTFYAVVFILFVWKKLKYIEVAGLAGLILVVLNAWPLGFWNRVGVNAVEVSGILCFWHLFFAGILFYKLKTDGERWYRHALIALCFVVQSAISDNIGVNMSLGGCFVLFYFFIYGKLTWINRKPLIFLGAISYSLYLVHQYMGYIMIRELESAGANAWLKFIIPTAVSIAVATVMTYALERPAMNFIRNGNKGLSGGTADGIKSREFMAARCKKFLLSTRVHAFILTALGAGLLSLSWHKWTNIMVDYGRELYTPWRITCGDVLYKDIASLFGPLAPYWNALLFKVFGPSIMTLVVFNAVLVAGITFLIYRFFSYATEKWIALFAGAAFLTLFAFKQQYGDQGNHAYICPYTYSVTYAVFLSLWAIDLFAAQGRSGRDALLGGVGFLMGLAALSRIEIFITLVPAIALGLVFNGTRGRWPLPRFLKAGAVLTAGFFIPIGIAYFYFSTQLPADRVWPGILGYNSHWMEIARNYYYRHAAGLDYPGRNFKVMVTIAAGYGAVLAAFRWLCVGANCLEKGKKPAGFLFVFLGLTVLKLIVWKAFLFHYDWMFKGVPVLMIFVIAHLIVHIFRQKDEARVRRLSALLVMAAWGLLMLGKIFLNVQIYDMGFVYALPAVLLCLVLFLDWVPEVFERLYGRGRLAKALSSVLFIFIFAAAVYYMAMVYYARNVRVQAGPDTVLCSLTPAFAPGGSAVGIFLRDAGAIMGKDANFTVFPDGSMLNFLMKRKNPLPYGTFLPIEMTAYGEKEILGSFMEHRPDYIVWTNRSLSLFGLLGAGVDYARVITPWIFAHYHPVWRSAPDNGFILLVLKRSD